MITVTELDFEKAHSPEDIISTGISPLIKLTEMLEITRMALARTIPGMYGRLIMLSGSGFEMWKQHFTN